MNTLYKTLFFLFFSFSTFLTSLSGMEEGITLVVGSTRKEGTMNPYAKKIFGEKTDLTYRDEKITTLDIYPCDLSGFPHIQADASSYVFKGTPIKEALWELFPSLLVSKQFEYMKNSQKSAEEKFNNMMLMANAIRNIAQYMQLGAPLSIEHLPYPIFLDFKFYASSGQYFKKFNPFTCYLSPFFMENIEARNYIDVEKKVGYWKSILANKVSLFPWDDNCAMAAAKEAMEKHYLVLEAIQNLEKLLPTEKDLQTKLNIEYKLHKNNPKTFFEKVFVGSFSEMVGVEFSILDQKSSIQSFLERNGFDKVEIARKDNPYNKRRNVWMISGIRNDQPIPKTDDNPNVEQKEKEDINNLTNAAKKLNI